MTRLIVDFSDPDDLRDALEQIHERLAQLQARPPGPPPEAHSDAVSAETARRVVDDLQSRIGSERTWALLQAFAELDGDVTLSQIADHLGAEPDDIRARKFRFGRTENAINEKYGIELLPGVWHGSENIYWMPEAIKHEIRSRD